MISNQGATEVSLFKFDGLVDGVRNTSSILILLNEYMAVILYPECTKQEGKDHLN